MSTCILTEIHLCTSSWQYATLLFNVPDFCRFSDQYHHTFTAGLKPTCFTNPSHHHKLFSLPLDSLRGLSPRRFLVSYVVFKFFSDLSVLAQCGRLSWLYCTSALSCTDDFVSYINHIVSSYCVLRKLCFFCFCVFTCWIYTAKNLHTACLSESLWILWTAVWWCIGVYGDVIRVKIMFNKKDKALIQFADGKQAQLGTRQYSPHL